MKRFTIMFVLSVFVISALTTGCGGGTNSTSATNVAERANKEPLPLLGGSEILPNVFDDLHSTVYFKVNAPVSFEEDKAIAEIIEKKKEWEKQSPNKKIVTMTIVTGIALCRSRGYHYASPVGLLAHYEQR